MKRLVIPVIYIGRVCLNVVYMFHKLWPVKHQVACLSRQHDEASLDVKLLMEELKSIDPTVNTVVRCKKIPPGAAGKIAYIFYMLGPEMHALATSEVVVLEGYSITASILHHRKNLKVIQMWHALGILKKFAFLAIGTEEGRDEGIAKAMRMHKNYDYILASGEFCRPFYAKAFGYGEDKVKIIPLPRTDLLKNKDYKIEMRQRILNQYPELADEGKHTLLYAPTFRVDGEVSDKLYELIETLDFGKYNLIVKLHPIDRTAINSDKVLTCDEFTTIELFSVADAMISDYSSVIFEAAAAVLPVYLYTYDLHEYIQNRGFCIDFMEDVPLEKYLTAESLVKAIEAGKNESYNRTMQEFSDKFIAPGNHNTEKLAKFIIDLIMQEEC